MHTEKAGGCDSIRLSTSAPIPQAVNSAMSTKTSFLLTAQVIVSGVTLFLLYRYLYVALGAASLGLWSLVLATTGVTRFAELGLAGSLSRFVARYLGLDDPLRASLVVETGLLTIFAAMSCVCLIGFPIVWLLVGKVIPQARLTMARELLPYAAVSVVLSTVASAVQSALDGCSRLDLRARIAILANLVYVCLGIFAAHRFGLKGLAWAQLAQSAVAFILGWSFLRRLLPDLSLAPRRWRPGVLREMLGYSVYYQVAGISSLAYEPVTKMLLAKYGGLAELGFFEMANRVAFLFRSVVIAPQQALLPAAARAKEGGSRNSSTSMSRPIKDSWRRCYPLSPSCWHRRLLFP